MMKKTKTGMRGGKKTKMGMAGGKKTKMGYAGCKKTKMGMAGGKEAKMPMSKDPKTGKMVPTFAIDGRGKMQAGGRTVMMTPKMMANGGATGAVRRDMEKKTKMGMRGGKKTKMGMAGGKKTKMGMAGGRRSKMNTRGGKTRG